MASLGSATSRTTGLLVPASMVVIGSLGATVATDVAKDVYDVPIQGGDAAYPIAATVLLNMFMGGQAVRFVSLGMLSSAVSEVADAYGLI